MFDSSSGKNTSQLNNVVLMHKYGNSKCKITHYLTFSLLCTLGELQLGDKLTKHKLTHVACPCGALLLEKCTCQQKMNAR